MPKKILYILIFTAFIAEGHAQKIIEKQWDASGISKLVIESDVVFEIEIVSEKIEAISVSTHIHGETSENVVLDVHESNGILTINTGFTPFFEAQNDKLAAHKVLAIEMYIKIPESMEVEIDAKIASVEGNGSFKSFVVGLENGSCRLYNFTGNARLLTKAGEITVYTTKNAKGQALTREGTIYNELPTTGKFTIYAESSTGAISLFQTK
ncbi:hypothetical protein ATE92_0947 [Ulvibacter sp. MAR_2010_11]|uniref:hypothetical protein n=1 Tax=Ulvibacter sp. MAR_2010_11 TaxID=1250229 RepID=UPI000C2C3AD8|nr:hypothetical protein [Ulvibacter sp. MAR_2010_11]PKA82808.1 hypothetical protein ATE92_0947 [Ulvibacter sp. MAR_2010_11]